MVSDYGEFIKEVFIDPIRTVVVVDDEFPTLDALLDKESGERDRKWKTQHSKLAREIIRFCHEREPPWIVEIHDGQTPSPEREELTASHLQYSDLMVLDYHLNGTQPDDGTEAIQILRRLAENDHFNLVIVYTKGDDERGGHIERVIKEIAVGLSSLDTRLEHHEKSLQAIKSTLEKWEDEEPNITEKLEKAVDDGVFLKVSQLDSDISNTILSWPELRELRTLIEAAPIKIKSRQVLKWALHRRQQALKPKLTTGNYGDMRFHLDGDHTNWIRTDRLFITVVSKTNEPSILPEKLAEALHHWMPPPHRLLMSKMRAELDERGVLAEGEILSNRHLQTGWLEEFLTEDQGARSWKIKSTINRHWESLGDAIQVKVMDFSERLADHLIAEGREKAISEHAPLNPEKHRIDVAAELNRHICSKPIEGSHLTTGHVLRIERKGTGDEHWLCLSPACDLVPGQKETGWHGRLGDHMPFIAVQLFKCKPDDALSDAAGGNYLFLGIDASPKAFSFTPVPQKANDESVARIANPKWEQMFAANKGQFGKPDDRTLSIIRISQNGAGLEVGTVPACVVAQLRYEYAINLLQRLGMNLSRVGLDFIPVNIAPADSG